MKILLFDIEGTTTDIHFVHKVLFPYSLDRLEGFILDHQKDPQVFAAIEDVRKTVLEENKKQLTLPEVIIQLSTWIKTDRKHGALKLIQGLIWDEGYTQGDFKSHLYPEVVEKFKDWKKLGLTLAIYSSGSVGAQKSLFKHTEYGDITPLLSNFFDTQVGGKREATSYQKISDNLKTAPTDIAFFSDIKEELDAAKSVGLHTFHVFRDVTLKHMGHESIASFSDAKISV